jgi:hypothetical protein
MFESVTDKYVGRVGYYIMRSLGVLCSSVRTVTVVDGGNHTENGHLEHILVGRTNLQGIFRNKL